MYIIIYVLYILIYWDLTAIISAIIFLILQNKNKVKANLGVTETGSETEKFNSRILIPTSILIPIPVAITLKIMHTSTCAFIKTMYYIKAVPSLPLSKFRSLPKTPPLTNPYINMSADSNFLTLQKHVFYYWVIHLFCPLVFFKYKNMPSPSKINP